MNKEEVKFRAVLKEVESLAQEAVDWESPQSPLDEEIKISEGKVKSGKRGRKNDNKKSGNF